MCQLLPQNNTFSHFYIENDINIFIHRLKHPPAMTLGSNNSICSVNNLWVQVYNLWITWIGGKNGK